MTVRSPQTSAGATIPFATSRHVANCRSLSLQFATHCSLHEIGGLLGGQDGAWRSIERQAVPVAVNGMDEVRMMRVDFNFLPKPSNGVVDRSRRRRVGVAPDLAQQLAPVH